MAELTLESLAERVAALETALAAAASKPLVKDWRRAVGLCAGSEFMKQVDEEGRRIREAERAVAHQDCPETDA